MSLFIEERTVQNDCSRGHAEVWWCPGQL